MIAPAVKGSDLFCVPLPYIKLTIMYEKVIVRVVTDLSIFVKDQETPMVFAQIYQPGLTASYTTVRHGYWLDSEVYPVPQKIFPPETFLVNDVDEFLNLLPVYQDIRNSDMIHIVIDNFNFFRVRKLLEDAIISLPRNGKVVCITDRRPDNRQ